MHDLQNIKRVQLIAPQAIVKNAAFTSYVIDLQDFEGCGYLEIVGMLGVTDVALTVCRVYESAVKTDDHTLGGTPALVKDSTVKPGATDDLGFFVFGLDLRKPRERYLQLQCTAANGSSGMFLTAWAEGKPLVSSSDADDRGLLFAEYA